MAPGARDLNEAIRSRTLGEPVELLLFGLGRYRLVRLMPAPAPELTQSPYPAPKPPKLQAPNPYR